VRWALSISSFCRLVSNRLAVRFALLVVAMEVQARYALVTLAAHGRSMAVKSTNLTKECCAGLVSAFNVL